MTQTASRSIHRGCFGLTVRPPWHILLAGLFWLFCSANGIGQAQEQTEQAPMRENAASLMLASCFYFDSWQNADCFIQMVVDLESTPESASEVDAGTQLKGCKEYWFRIAFDKQAGKFAAYYSFTESKRVTEKDGRVIIEELPPLERKHRFYMNRKSAFPLKDFPIPDPRLIAIWGLSLSQRSPEISWQPFVLPDDIDQIQHQSNSIVQFIYLKKLLQSPVKTEIVFQKDLLVPVSVDRMRRRQDLPKDPWVSFNKIETTWKKHESGLPVPVSVVHRSRKGELLRLPGLLFGEKIKKPSWGQTQIETFYENLAQNMRNVTQRL